MHRFIRVVSALAAVALLVPVAGQASQEPILALTPSTNGAFDYGTVVACQTVSQTFTLTNSGGSASAALTVSLTGPAAFTKTADGCTATSLGPGKSCSVTVAYSPTAAGQGDTATLAASGRKAAASTSLTLTGTGAGPLHIYWGHSPFVPRVGRADINGQNVNQAFIAIVGPSEEVSVAVDSSHIYWTNSFTGEIGRADLNGSNVNQSFITGAYGPAGIAVDSSHIYWTNYAGPNDADDRPCRPGRAKREPELHHRPRCPRRRGCRFRPHLLGQQGFNGTIGRADLDGQNVNQNFIIPPASYPWGVTVDSGHIYWTNGLLVGTIGRADLDGQNADPELHPCVQPQRSGNRFLPHLLG